MNSRSVACSASMRRQARRAGVARMAACCCGFIAIALAIAPQSGSTFAAATGARSHRRLMSSPRVAMRAAVSGIQSRSTVNLELSRRNTSKDFYSTLQKLEEARYDATALDSEVQVAMDGTQRLRKVDIADTAMETAGSATQLAEVVLMALQEAHDKSMAGVKPEVWSLYESNGALLQAPLAQIGYGETTEDVWSNVNASQGNLKLVEELFDKFDVDKDGYWSCNETRAVQMATEGTEMPEDNFIQLIISTAPDDGRKLSEEDLAKGLSKQVVTDMYTSKEMQKKLGFALDIHKDHSLVFKKNGETEAAAAVPAVATSVPAAD
mmetsp:Transcript_53461/g.98891  ORF Transcript_53461/g.98891 Transcript_53461/m.98891 type:complete len:323 (+) Transcript_53461:78-1046(+)